MSEPNQLPPQALTKPQRRIVQRAASASDPGFVPTEALKRLGAVAFEGTAESFVELSKAAGVDRSHLYDLIANPAACAWLVAHGKSAAAAGLGAVHARLLELALSSRSPAAIELYLRVHDPDFKEKTQAPTNITATNVLVQQVSSMSDSELSAFLNHKRNQLGKEAQSFQPAPSRDTEAL